MTLTVGFAAPLNDVSAATGLGQYATSLLSALADLESDADRSLPEHEYVVVVDGEGNTDWVPPSVDERMAVVESTQDERRRRLDGLLDEFDVDVVQFLFPVYYRTRRPNIFNPADLNHRQYPEHFSEELLRGRHNTYPAACRDAAIVDTYSQEMKTQILETYDNVDPEKVHPVPMGPAISSGDRTAESAELFAELPDSFALFPANLWPHKNHERLVEAIQRIQNRHGERVPLVCTGIRDTPEVPPEYRVESVPEAPQVTDLGFVDVEDLRALYRACRLLVYPTLYEGGGLPVLEAWEFDAPVACSDIPVLREKGGEAAAYFDPESVPEMADTIHELWTDAERRADLVERAQQRRELFTWERTARAYHSLYRKAVGLALDERDREALVYPPEP